jgi:YVTN family beta-propeller protein
LRIKIMFSNQILAMKKKAHSFIHCMQALLKCVLVIAFLFFNFQIKAQKAKLIQEDKLYKTLSAKRVQLPNQWKLTPAGTSLPLGDLPLNIVVSPSKKLFAVTNNGVDKHFIQLFNTEGGIKEVSKIDIAKAWYGMAFSEDEKHLYASGGNDNTIVVFNINNQKLTRDTVIKLGEPWSKDKICPAGIALDGATKRLFTVTKEDSMLYVCNTQTLGIEKKIPLSSEPFSVIISKTLGEIYVSLWGAKSILVFDLKTLDKKTEIAVGDHPNEMILNKKQDVLFVANSLDNSVSVVDLKTKKVLETLNAALYPDAPNGSTTNGVALSDDEKTLYIANADNNCLAVFDVEKIGYCHSKGFIPTGWYPTNVKILGKKIIVANGKGMNSAANPNGPNPFNKRDDNRAAQYIGKLFYGTLSIIDVPNEKQLAVYSKLTYENTPYSKEKELITEGEQGNPIPMRVGDLSPIKYVFYIIKENRTYDQVLSDVQGGNGDTSLLLFPESVTPNQHKIVKDYALFDNFYVDAEVSADGHNWSMAAYANDFVEKTWVASYGGKGGNYDFEGTRKVAFPKSGFFWDNCKRHNVTYRTYGEFADDGKANYETIEGHFCPNYSSWDMNYQDISREKDWEHDFDSLLNINQVARFNSIRFGNDHTSGMSKGAYSPKAAVADNDLAVGHFIEHLSNSTIWKESAVFIIEDDAQNGADHVDAHRSTAYIVSPYLKRNYIDHTMYSTSSMVRTMELILGLPPMSQYDAAATPMWRAFTSQANFTPYISIEPAININERNIVENVLSRRSQYFNLAELDAVPEREFNEVLWKAIKGLNSELPPIVRAAFVSLMEKNDD